jgi:hypothetical protein
MLTSPNLKIEDKALMNTELLTSLEHVKWNIVSQTYGSSHSTLIGLLVDWWITNSIGESHWALESGLPYRKREPGEKGEKQERCDAIFVEQDMFKGIIEIEGSRYEHTIKKMTEYFKSDYLDYSNLQFGIFFAYGYGCQPQIWEKYMDKFIQWGKEHTEKLREEYPGGQLIILALDKSCEQKRLGSHALGEYCQTPSQVRGTIIQDGKALIDEYHLVWSRLSV